MGECLLVYICKGSIFSVFHYLSNNSSSFLTCKDDELIETALERALFIPIEKTQCAVDYHLIVAKTSGNSTENTKNDK